MRGGSLAPEVVELLLRGRFGRPYVYRSSCESTQRLLSDEEPEGAVAVAEEQTAGRGRLGRRWSAPAGSSVLVSLLLRPRPPMARWPELSPRAARACAEAIVDVTGLEPTVRFPNDVLLSGRKVAGILAEGRRDHVVLGIGINVNVAREELPADAAGEPTSLLLELGATVERAPLLAALLKRLEEHYDSWQPA